MTIKSRAELRKEIILDKNIDIAFEETGGFGNFQFFLAFFYFAHNTSIKIMGLAFAYLTKVPREYWVTY